MYQNASYYIEKLDLVKHPEGGYYKEIYRSKDVLAKENLPQRYGGDRSMSTSIYYLLENDDFSAFHKLRSDELWHFYKGTAITIFCIDEQGIMSEILLGDDLDNNESLQVTIKRGTWFAACINKSDSFILLGCTVAPGFNFNDFEIAKREDLLEIYPEYEKVILKLTLV